MKSPLAQLPLALLSIISLLSGQSQASSPSPCTAAASAAISKGSIGILPQPQQQIFGEKTSVIQSISIGMRPKKGSESSFVKLEADPSGSNKVQLAADSSDSDHLNPIWQELPSKEGAYAIEIADAHISIYAHDATGIFYARQSLIQLLQGGDNRQLNAQSDPYTGQSLEQIFLGKQLADTRIWDWPDLPYRGCVEGYYGRPWSQEERKSQIRFYGRNKMNTYIWAPKDDPYHHGKGACLPYPEETAAQIRELCEIARAKQVKFVWSIHPADTVDWSKEGGKPDLEALCKKLEVMYELGVRHYGVFVDDSGGEIRKAARQAELCNYITENFIKTKPELGPVIMCPTGYTRAWTPAPWLKELGSILEPDTKVMWTGDTVVCNITQKCQSWVKEALGRSTFIWWNWPCNDFLRNRLSLGRSYGLYQGADMKDLLSGFVANPMENAEASKIGLMGVGNYAWNIEDFQSEKVWKEGIRRLYPESAAAVQCLANHNSNLGVNSDNFYREESVDIAPLAIELSQAIALTQGQDAHAESSSNRSSTSSGSSDAESSSNRSSTSSGNSDAESPSSSDSASISESPAAASPLSAHASSIAALATEFANISAAAAKIQSGSDSQALAKEIAPWLEDFAALGETGQLACALLLKEHASIQELQALQEAWQDWQSRPRAKTGATVLRPLVSLMSDSIDARYYARITGRPQGYSKPIFSSKQGDITQRAENIFDGNDMSYWDTRDEQKAGDFYSLDFGAPREIRSIDLLMGGPHSEAYIRKGQMESSLDGQTWQPLGSPQEQTRVTLSFHGAEQVPPQARYLRYRVLEDSTNYLSICRFDINKPLPARAESDVAGLNQIRSNRRYDSLGIERVMEIKSMKTGQSIRLHSPEAVRARGIEIDLEKPEAAQHARVELLLADGSRYSPKLKIEGNKISTEPAEFKPGAPIIGMEYFYDGKESIDIKLTSFKVLCPPYSASASINNASDGRLLSYYDASKGMDEEIRIPEGSREIIVMSKNMFSLQFEGKQGFMQGLCRASIPEGKKSIRLSAPPQKGAKLYEIIFR